MLRLTQHSLFAIAAITVAFGSAGLARRAHAPAAAVAEAAPPTIEPFALAKLLSEAPPDVVVISLDPARHALRFDQPVALYGATDDAFLENAPKLRRIVLVGFDQVRVDRLARRLMAAHRDVRVLAGGLDAWDKTMDSDPVAPAANAGGAAWQLHREVVALRHAFGDAQLAPAAPVAMPVAPVAAPGGPPKKREGC